MDRCALLVDAGYFFAAGTEAAFGTPSSRREVRLVDPIRALSDLKQQTTGLCDGVQLLRVYWYDAMPGPRVSAEQAELAIQPGLKLRLGVLNSVGQQKGVDSLVVTDLIELARNRAITDAVLLSGDEDLRIGVQIAQSYGLRVHLWGAGNTDKNVSRTLRMEADSFDSIDDEWFVNSFERTPTREADADDASSPWSSTLDEVDGETLEETAVRAAQELLSDFDRRDLDQLVAAFEVGSAVPREFDGRLIAMTARARGGVKFTAAECRAIRGVFVVEVRNMRLR